MLKNLNPITAARFGRLLDEREGLPEGEDRPVEAGERLELLSCPGEVRLGPGRGMAALCLCREGRAGDMFYLDKPVALKPGTEFALLPLEEGSAVRLAADRPLERAGSLPTAEPGLIRPTIRVERILTLFYQEKEPGFFFPGERHRPYELIYVDHGRLHNVVGGRDYALGQNQALIVPPDQWHMQYGEEGERVGFITASFTCAGPLPEEILLRVLDRDQTARELARALAAEEEREQPYRGDLLVAVLQAMLALWARRAAGGGGEAVAAPATRRGECRILDQAIQYVAESTRDRLTVQSLARRCNVSTAYLSALFRRHLGISPGAYIMRTKLEESRGLICSGAGTISQIAQTLRFSSVQHFSAAFRRRYGIPPSVYARGVRE